MQTNSQVKAGGSLRVLQNGSIAALASKPRLPRRALSATVRGNPDAGVAPMLPSALAQAQAQVQPQRAQAQAAAAAVHSTAWYREHWDLNLWHYLPWWLQPASILASGLALFALALVLDNEEPTAKAAVIAAGPLLLYWALALLVLPTQFQRFAVQWMRQHPERASPLASRDEHA